MKKNNKTLLEKPYIGDLVARRQRWIIDAQLIGLVIGIENTKELFSDASVEMYLVLWTKDDKYPMFKWHLKSSLVVIDDRSEKIINKRKIKMY